MTNNSEHAKKYRSDWYPWILSSFLSQSLKSTSFQLCSYLIGLFVSFDFVYCNRCMGLFLPFQKWFCRLFWQFMYGWHLDHNWLLCCSQIINCTQNYLWKSKVTLMQSHRKKKMSKFFFLPWLFFLSSTSIQISPFSLSRHFWQIE